MGIDVEEWLEDWVDEHLQMAEYVEPGEMANTAQECIRAANDDGIATPDLIEAAGGDLEAYLVKAQNAFTDAEIKRKVEDD